MYITRVEIQNIRSIKHLVWEIDAANAPSWHVILGDNGSGKSTFVRSIAAIYIGENERFALRQSFNDWIQNKTEIGTIETQFIHSVLDLVKTTIELRRLYSLYAYKTSIICRDDGIGLS